MFQLFHNNYAHNDLVDFLRRTKHDYIFSATGNSKYVASKVAKATNDSIKSITEITGSITLHKGEALGIVIPTYFFWVPDIVKTFLENVEIKCSKNTYIYSIATCGGTSGQASQMVAGC